jgi:TolB-like protein/DNA-binding winged helix-turn-helix (wHTH) protein
MSPDKWFRINHILTVIPRQGPEMLPLNLGGSLLEARTLIRFGVFEVDLDSGELRRKGVRIKLQEQPFQVLAALLERPRDVLTREDLQKRLWPSDVSVDFDRGLNRAINRLREALGDDAENPRFIETLPQRGYRFVADVEVAATDHSPSPPEAKPEITAPRLMRRRWLVASAGALVAAPLLALGYRRWLAAAGRIESIAVLPIENLSGNREQEYFSDGMTDELIGEIARIGSLRVISRTSVMQYKGDTRKSLPTIARELNVDAILEGTVVYSGQKVRITAQLIRARDDRHLWSEKYERSITDILELQSEVAREIASQIQLKLTPQERTYLTRSRPVNPNAYEAFLKGKFFMAKGIGGISKSIDFFRQAIELDPLQAESYASLAVTLCYAGLYGFRPSGETYPEARVAALKALELDESSATAYTALAEVKAGYDWDLAGAEADYKRALQFNPSYLPTRIQYAECLTRLGQYDEAIKESQRALALDPVSPLGQVAQAMIFFRCRRYDEAIRFSKQALDLEPSIVNALWWQGLSYEGKGRFPDAIASLTKAIGMSEELLFRALLGHVYGRAGERAKALGILNELSDMVKVRFVSPMDFAMLYAGMGDADLAFQWLEKAREVHDARIHEVRSMEFDSIRADPRYADLTRRVGLPLQVALSR